MTLADYLREHGLTQAVFAERINSTDATVSRIIAGHFKPSLRLAVAIERQTAGAIPASCWIDQAVTA